jgi:tetratricopeptide (TPR) repeat protein
MDNRRTHLLALLMVLVLLFSACSKEKSVEEYLQDGQEYLGNDDLSKAIAELEEALKRDPGLAEAHRLLGEALGRSGRWPEAVTQFEAYQALAQDDAGAYFALGEAYVQTGDLEKAATTFAEGVRVDPSFLESHSEEIAGAADALLQAGKEALQAGDLATADELLGVVAPLVSGQGEVYFLLGQAYQQAGDVVQALSAFANAVGLSPELATQYADEIDAVAQRGLEMGQEALDTGDLTTAAQMMEAVAKLLPDVPRAHFLLGNIYNENNQFTQAIQAYQTVLRLEPDSSSAYTNMGVVYYKMGDLETAVQQYEAALDLEPDDAETHYLLGAAYVQMEQLEQGKAEFEAAVELDPQLAPPYIGLGNVYLLQGDIESALETLEQAIALSPGSPEAYFALGQVYIQLGDIAEARSALEKVLSLNPSPHWQQQVELLLESLESK